jgi:hypothetical protein
VVELIHSDGSSCAARQLVDAATLAAELGVDRSWVYAHRCELGAIQLGTGAKPRLRFDLAMALEVLASTARDGSRKDEAPRPGSKPSRRRRRRSDIHSRLLPIRGPAEPLDARGERSS